MWIGQDCQTFDVDSHTLSYSACATSLPTLCTNNNANSPTIQINGSPVAKAVIGTRDSHSFRFLGIPYAQAPVGALRFQRPVRLPTSTTIKETPILDATQFGSVCPQETGTDMNINRATESEDCLFLNVFTPSVNNPMMMNGTPKLPVIVYFHGGGFVKYAGSSLFFEPGPLVSRGRVVVVTFNYRLGLLGVLENERLLSRSTLPGNLFLHDQIMALEWVQENIIHFGGDPTRVTLMGESAGAISIRAMLVIPKAWPLYHNIISQSDPVNMVFYNSRRVSSGILGANAMRLLNCTDLTCLQTVELSKILQAQEKVSEEFSATFNRSTPLTTFMPTIDGDLIKMDFLATLKGLGSNGSSSSAGGNDVLIHPTVRILWGSTHDESGSIMPTTIVPLSGQVSLFRQYFHDSRADVYLSPESFSIYPLHNNNNNNNKYENPSEDDSVRARLVKASTDLYFFCPRFYLAQRFPESYHRNIFHFRFIRGKHLGASSTLTQEFCSLPGTNRVCHFDDVVVSFGNMMGLGLVPSAEDARFARQVIDRFTLFAKFGHPNVHLRLPTAAAAGDIVSQKGLGLELDNPDVTGLVWEPFHPATRPVLELGLDSTMSFNAGRDTCEWTEKQNVFDFSSEQATS
ncbi:hypothetical protein BG004_001754 [Podila humilis]|nr:hypothetical protein BG004_001754 [Podila humilis]